jgi:N12 class adenine-specific DNA methylase
VSPRGLVTKLRANLEAIRLLKSIESEKRPATQSERDALVKYSGWGALSQAFDDEKARRISGGEIEQRRQTAEVYRGYGESEYYKNVVRQAEEEIAKLENWQSKWGDFHRQLRETLTDEEYRRAQRSTINAHYTAPEVISAMWDMASRLGFRGGNVLEPAAGIGHFVGLMPQELADFVKFHAVELDEISGRITRLLYPEADVQITGFQTADIADGSIDLAISNVPFANVPVTDKAIEAMGGPLDNLHDYFFGKTLTKLRPGGIAMFITSSFTMDKGNGANRRWLAERADLVAAFRLPNDAFKANAGTDVVTDVIILRKKDGTVFPGAQDWTNLDDARTHKGDTLRVNQYFAAHPNNVLGLLADDGSMYGDEREMTVHSDPARPVAVALQQAIDGLPANIAGEGSAKSARTGDTLAAVKLGNIIEREGKFYIQGQSEPDAALNDPKNRARVVQFLEVRNALNRQYDLELSSDATDEAIEANRRELNAAYDLFAQHFGDFHQPKNRSLFIDDPDYFRIVGAEIPEKMEGGIRALVEALKGKKRQSFVKADVFRKRVLKPRAEPTSAASLEDAFGISLGWRGRVDIPFIADLVGQPREQVERGLVEREVAVRDPETGQILSREQYLSGNVRRKLEVAKASGPEYARNVRILEPIIPADVPITEARFKIGATWIPGDIYAEYLASLGIRDVRIEYIQPPGGGRDFWHVNSSKARYLGTSYKDFGTNRISVTDLMDSLLNFQRLNITDKDGDTDIPATEAAKAAAKKLNAHFVDWARSTPTIAQRLAPIFNREVNAFAQRTYDGQHLTFPWASNDFDIFPDKKNVVWRAIQDGFGLVAHGVGGGKTILGSAIALELRRLGMARKPMIVVHNATLEQFADTIAQIAPSARVLVGRKDELAGPKRKEFLMRIAAGDWDAVVIAHSTFGLIEDDPEYQRKHMQALVDEVMQSLKDSGFDSLEEAKKGGRRDMSVKQRVKTIESLEGKIEELSKRRTDTGLLTFQQLGVDALIVDEVHAFKKMPFSTKLDVKGIDSGMSQRGYAMLMRARSIQERMNGKNVFTMTGTPVTNTLGEVWNMVRLVAPHLLKDYKIETFDQFVSKFAEVESVSEESPDGRRKMVERLSRVVNLPEWSTFFRLAADVRFGDAMVVKGRPGIKGGKPELVTVERTKGVAAWVDYIRGVLDAFSEMDPKEMAENPSLQAVPVQAYMASRAAAIDIRLIDSRAKDEPGSKANQMIARAMEIYRRTSDYSGAQVIFADSYQTVRTSLFQSVVPGGPNIELDPEKTEGTFNLYEDIKAKLIAQGVPESEIAIITDSKYDNEKRKKALFDEVNAGKVRIIIGSTKKLGTGVNMQQRMAAAHHLDVPWTPADLEQRDGRVYRQGNIHGEMGVDVELIRYGMKDSLDSALWQKLETKQRFITLALSGKIVGRELEEVDEVLTLAEQRAVLSGPYGQEPARGTSRTRTAVAARLSEPRKRSSSSVGITRRTSLR